MKKDVDAQGRYMMHIYIYLAGKLRHMLAYINAPGAQEVK